MRSAIVDDVLFKLNIAMDFQEVYKDSDLNLKKLASLVGVSDTILNKIIKSYYGYGFRSYLNDVRIKKLIEWLKIETVKPNVEKCLKITGYKSRVTFYNAFKSKTDVSFKEYFKIQSESKNSIPIIFETVAYQEE